ncbi:hypothetical protein BHE74_00048026 [Ensete ventricosum]|nr:hypothetical protein BHE74_00048026 [Ensete ventricosum]RZS19424.1 hypothetical protein BHM03_00051822 [Ensete ventricosum]
MHVFLYLFRPRFAISIFTAWYGRYIPVRQVAGTWTARYRAPLPPAGRGRSFSRVGRKIETTTGGTHGTMFPVQRCVNDFRTLLAEIVTVEAAAARNDDGKTVLNSWSEAKRLLKSDTRYSKMPSKDRESLWRRHTEDMLRKPKSVSDTKESPGTNGRNRMPSTADPLKRSPGRSHRRR